MNTCEFCKNNFLSVGIDKRACSSFGKTFEEIFGHTTLNTATFGCIFFTNVSKHEGIDHELRVIPQGELEECPLCTVGHNSEDLGGNDRCFHCDTCGWVACIISIPDGETTGSKFSVENKIKSHLKDIERRLIKYYAKRASSEPQTV